MGKGTEAQGDQQLAQAHGSQFAVESGVELGSQAQLSLLRFVPERQPESGMEAG